MATATATTANSLAPAPAASAPSRALARLWVGVLLPPASWIAELLSRYMTVRWAHTHAVRWPLRLATAVCLGGVLLGALLCWRSWREARRSSQAPAGASEPAVQAAVAPAERRLNHATLAAWGLALAAYFLLLVLAQAFPVFVLDVGEIT